MSVIGRGSPQTRSRASNPGLKPMIRCGQACTHDPQLMHDAASKWCDSRPFSMRQVSAPVGHELAQMPHVLQLRWSMRRLAHGSRGSWRKTEDADQEAPRVNS